MSITVSDSIVINMMLGLEMVGWVLYSGAWGGGGKIYKTQSMIYGNLLETDKLTESCYP